MSDGSGTICYISQQCKGAPIFLMVMDQENGACHRFPLTVLNAARLAYECAGHVNAELGGFNKTVHPK